MRCKTGWGPAESRNMTTIAPVPARIRLSLPTLILAVVAGVMTGVIVAALGPIMGMTLGYFWGGAITVALLTIALCPARALFDDLLVMGMIWIMLALQWMLAGSRVGFGAVTQCLVVVLAMQWSLLGSVRFVHWMGLPRTLARALVGLVMAGAITSPVWLGTLLHRMSSPWLVETLCNVHVLLVMNAKLPALDYWTQQPLAYKYLTNLGQDVAYAPAKTILWTLLVHGAAGLLGLVRRRESSTVN